MTKPADWPRHMVEQPVKAGVAYYWQVPTATRKAGCPLPNEPLGTDYSKAVRKANVLNAQLDSWRLNEITEHAPHGSVRWWLTTYKTTRDFTQNGKNHRNNIRVKIDKLCSYRLPKGRKGLETFGQMTLDMCSARFANGFYDLLHPGRERQAEIEIRMLRKAWQVVKREWPDDFPRGGNPFDGVTLVRRKRKTKAAATREEVYLLADALRDIGHPHLGAAALICFEWHQRPENVCAGAIRWTDYQAGVSVQIEHWKTHVEGKIPLCDDNGPLFPEIEEYLAALPQLGVPIVLTPRAPHKPYPKKTATDAVVRARRHAGLPDHVTLDACRHGGLTELGDAELTESQEMALSGHQSTVIRGYVKKTEKQRLKGARRRIDSRTNSDQESE